MSMNEANPNPVQKPDPVLRLSLMANGKEVYGQDVRILEDMPLRIATMYVMVALGGKLKLGVPAALKALGFK
jgi:hypothetical protein